VEEINRPSEPFPLDEFAVAVLRDGSTSKTTVRQGPPPCVDGMNIGLASLKQSPPHDGERHPDGDELLYLISGDVSVFLEEEPQRTVHVRPAECFVIPKGIWHRVIVHQPSRLIYITPGPGNESRPKSRESGAGDHACSSSADLLAGRI
jgi:mannose-6-phosphate isomerase-like protein (cupin superfamily)